MDLRASSMPNYRLSKRNLDLNRYDVCYSNVRPKTEIRIGESRGTESELEFDLQYVA